MAEATATRGLFSELAPKFNRGRFKKLTETLSFQDYLERVSQRPQLAFSAFQRLYNMVVSPGVTTHEKYRKTVTRYKFFDDPSIPICGLDDTLESLVKHIKGAADWYGTERRILLLHGPTGIHVHFEVRSNGVKRNPELYLE
jgi:serine protein kinase